MANVKISDLTAATTLATTDQLEINNSGTSKSVTGQVVADLAASSTNTLTNKTFDTAGTGNTFKVNGTAISDKTGTGKVVLNTSPTLVTPALGTPSAIVLTNATSVPVAQATGTLPVLNGGTGQTSYTDGQLLIGNSTGNTLAKGTITAGSGITVTNGNGSITIATSSASAGWMFGDGADGNVTVSGATTLTRDMYYNNLTLSGSAAITTAGYRIFVAGTLDISAAPAGAIKWNLVASLTGLTSSNLGGSANGGVAMVGSTGAGTTGGSGSQGTTGGAAAAGAGGTGGGGAGGGAGVSISPTQFFGINVDSDIGTYLSTITTRANQLAGSGGSGGGSGGGGGGTNGATSGRGGGGGGTVVVVANVIARGSNSTASIIQAIGSDATKGSNATGGTAGGGGGGSGGAGGLVVVVYGSRTGSTITGAIDVSGGAGGNGGNGFSTGLGGGGGGSGGSGTVYVWQAGSAPVITTTVSGSAGNATVTSTGGSGASANTKKVDL